MSEYRCQYTNVPGKVRVWVWPASLVKETSNSFNKHIWQKLDQKSSEQKNSE